jgi:hypothetical protein
MARFAGASEPSGPFFGRIRQRVLISLLAALLALAQVEGHDWRRPPAPTGMYGRYSTEVSIDGTRYALACAGQGVSTVVIVGETALAPVMTDMVQAQLARFVRLCSITAVEGVPRTKLNLAVDRPTALNREQIPAPYVIIAQRPASTTFGQATGPAAALVTGMVFITLSPSPPTGLALTADGGRRPLPLDDPVDTMLAILALFWPSDEA